jgi:hypothetical protein
MPYIYTSINQSLDTKPMVRELDAERCAVRLSANRRKRQHLAQPQHGNRPMPAIYLLDLAFIVRELKVRIPAHHTSSSPPFPSNSNSFIQYTHIRRKKTDTGSSDSTPGERPKACLLGSILALMQCNHAVLTGFWSRPRLEPQYPQLLH